MDKHPSLSDFPVSPSWALGLGDAGRILIWAALAAFALAVVFTFLRRESPWPTRFMTLGAGLVAGTFGVLASLFVLDRYEYGYVFKHSEKANELQYKVAAVWSGQEGSFLLWALMSAIFAVLAVRGTGPYRRVYVGVISAFLASICGILTYESPFVLTLIEGKALVPPNGLGLQPSLYNYWVVIHPPTIFAGFGSLVVMFGYACAALARKEYDDWAVRVRPWALLSLSIVGVGLVMGGFWAYEMLGWGGFWAWDPVENVSFVPWILTAILVHGLIVQSTRGRWHLTNLLLAGLPFLAFTYGTFLTRSDLMKDASVHSFAGMEKNAHRILLGFLLTALAGFLALWLARLARHKDETKCTTPALSRERAYAAGNILLAMIGAAAAIGMSVPMINSLTHAQLAVVVEREYHNILSWPFVPVMLLIAIVPFVSWGGDSGKKLFGKVMNSLSAALLVTGGSMIWINSGGLKVDPKHTIQFFNGAQVPAGKWLAVLLFLCAFAASSNIARIAALVRRSPMGIGGFLSHLGLAVAMVGLILSRGYERKQNFIITPGSTGSPGLETASIPMKAKYLPNASMKIDDRHNTMDFSLSGDLGDVVVHPGLYYTFRPNQEPQPTSIPYIQRSLTHDLYAVAQPVQTDVAGSIKLKPGETGELSGPLWDTMTEVKYRIKYKEFVREGEAGKAGTRFGAKLMISNGAAEKEFTPKMIVGGGPAPAQIDEHFTINLVGMNAADRSVELGLGYVTPVLPLQVFYKPFTALVWLGTGILTLGGLLSAAYRRVRKNSDAKPSPEAEPQQESAPEKENALVSVP